MMKRVLLLLLFIPFILSSASYKNYIGYLKNIPGYKAKKPVGADASFGEIIMINVTRTYTRDEKEMTATIHVSNQSSTVLPLYRSGFIMQKGSVMIKVIWIKGFITQISYDRERRAGTLTVFLHTRKDKVDVMGTLTLSLKNITIWEGVSLVKHYNLIRLKNQIESIE